MLVGKFGSRPDGWQLTVSHEGSLESFFPTSLLVHSSVLSEELLVIPGTTRGILLDVFGIRFACR